MELISIVVPVYNVKDYIKCCVESLIHQTYRNIEIILVDDGSTDESGKICDQLAERDSRIKVVHKKNEGLGYARNTGLENITGQYVTFIDSDDYVDKNQVEDLYHGIRKNGADTCIGGFKRVDNVGRILFTESYEEKFYGGDSVKYELFLRMLGSSPNCHDAIKIGRASWRERV